MIFGFSIYYEYAIKSLPHREIGINRTLVCSQEIPKFNDKILKNPPNLDAYYSELYN